jgi:hypothetical protein
MFPNQAGGEMQEHVPHIGDFVSTKSCGLVDIAHVDPDLVYLDDAPNRPIPISNLVPSPDCRQDIWVIRARSDHDKVSP